MVECGCTYLVDTGTNGRSHSPTPTQLAAPLVRVLPKLDLHWVKADAGRPLHCPLRTHVDWISYTLVRDGSKVWSPSV